MYLVQWNLVVTRSFGTGNYLALSGILGKKPPKNIKILDQENHPVITDTSLY